LALNHNDFIRLLGEQFPEIAGSIDDFAKGILHMEMGHFSHHSMDALKAGQWDQLARHFSLAERLLKDGDEALQNAVNVSYLENLPLYLEGREYAKGLALMSPYLRAEWTAMQDYLDQLFAPKPDTPKKKKRPGDRRGN
jgi:hypothetical protein